LAWAERTACCASGCREAALPLGYGDIGAVLVGKRILALGAEACPAYHPAVGGI
jgi:hypothetical protein